jgi:hypothetical protein
MASWDGRFLGQRILRLVLGDCRDDGFLGWEILGAEDSSTGFGRLQIEKRNRGIFREERFSGWGVGGDARFFNSRKSVSGSI